MVAVETDQEYFKKRNSTALAAAQSDNPNNMLLAVANLSDQPVTVKKGEVVGKVQCSSRIKGCPQANYTWSQISRMRRSLEQIKQFEVNSRTKSINRFNSKKITKCQTQFKRDG